LLLGTNDVAIVASAIKLCCNPLQGIEVVATEPGLFGYSRRTFGRGAHVRIVPSPSRSRSLGLYSVVKVRRCSHCRPIRSRVNTFPQPTERLGHPLRRLRSATTRPADRNRAAVSSASGQSSCLRHRGILRPAQVRDDVAPVGPDERFLVAPDVVDVDLGKAEIDEVLQVLAVPVEVG